MNEAFRSIGLLRPVAAGLLFMVVLGGCHKKQTEASNENFKRAINAYFYNHRDECLFTAARKFPDEVKVGEKQRDEGHGRALEGGTAEAH